ncbi:MAG: type IV secretion protein IcmK [Coxiella sp. (in: Bacteria)]|nr:MAG: type IV secretion protein IcmK [Coxiella sp. (in: g-proteobacteria)]
MAQVKTILSQNKSTQAAQSQAASTTAAASTASNSAFGDTSMSQQAFANTVRSMMPLTPDQIRTLRQLFNNSQRAAADYPGTPPKPTSSSVVVNLSPGATPPIIRLRSGFVTSLVFLDSTGEPWPIQAYDIGDPNSFNIQWNQKGNTLLVQSSSAYKSGNLAVMLKGQDTPVMVTLMPGQNAVDYRVDLRVPGLGPNASATVSSLPDVANPQLLDFLNGVPPNGAKEVQVQGGPCQAWESAGHLYLRTQLTVLSPSWLASMSSPDGTHVYEIMKSPVVLASFRGKVIQLMIQGV